MFHCGSSIPEAVTSSQIPTVGYFRKRCQKQGNWFGKFSPAKSDQSKGGLAAREFMGVCVCENSLGLRIQKGGGLSGSCSSAACKSKAST